MTIVLVITAILALEEQICSTKMQMIYGYFVSFLVCV